LTSIFINLYLLHVLPVWFVSFSQFQKLRYATENWITIINVIFLAGVVLKFILHSQKCHYAALYLTDFTYTSSVNYRCLVYRRALSGTDMSMAHCLCKIPSRIFLSYL